MSCTRIRCAIATFACNDGGFETGFFARHFMKNREETTAIHYNLLSNRRHALNIAMKLYKSFLGINGEVINVHDEEVDKIVTYLMASSKHCDKDEVMNWFIKHNPDITNKELDDFKYILDENKVESGAKTFYGQNIPYIFLSF